MHGDSRTTGDARRPEVEVVLRPPEFPSFVALVVLRGEHDLGTAGTIEAALAPLLGSVLIDFSTCHFIDSTVLGILIRKGRDLEREGHRLELIVPPESATVARVFEIVQIREFMTVHAQSPRTAPTLEDGAVPPPPSGKAST